MSDIKTIGHITIAIDHKNAKSEILSFPNTILDSGRAILAGFLSGQIKKDLFVKSMLFGDGGYDSEESIKRTVNQDRNSLFGVTRVNKPVIGQIDPMLPSQVIFTAVITFEEANGHKLNEMALQLSNGHLFSMATFPDLGKTNQLQLTFNWVASFI